MFFKTIIALGVISFITSASTDSFANTIIGESHDLLLSRTGAEKPVVRSDAANQLKEFGDNQTVSRLLQLTQDSDWRVRFDAIKTLGRLAEPTASKVVEPLVNDPMPHVRMISVWSLYQIGDLGTVPTIISAVKDSDSQVTQMAQRVLKNLSATGEERSFDEWTAWWDQNQSQIAANWDPF